MKSVYICGDGFLGKELLGDFNNDNSYYVSRQFLELKRPQLLEISQLDEFSKKLRNQKNRLFINASGQSNVQKSFSNYRDSVEQPAIQVLKHLELLSAMQEPILYVYISSAAVYGETPQLGSNEKENLNPMSPYAEGKLKAEEVLNSFDNSVNPLISIVILRVFSAYSNNLTSRILQKIVVDSKKNRIIDLAGSGNEMRDFVHSSDISRAIKFLVETEKKDKQIYNIGSGQGIQIQKLLELADGVFDRLYDKRLHYSFDGSRRAGDPIHLVAKIQKLLDAGFTPSIKPREGLVRYFEKNFAV